VRLGMLALDMSASEIRLQCYKDIVAYVE